MRENYEEQAVLGTSDKLRKYTERKTLKKQEKTGKRRGKKSVSEKELYGFYFEELQGFQND